MSRRRAFRFESAPHLPGSDRLARPLLGSINRLLHTFWNIEVEGADNIPLDGPAIICPNHLSFCDSMFVPAALPRRTWAIGKAEYLDDWKTRHIFPAMGMIPIDRSGGKASRRALDTAADVLEAGKLFMIYPEGTRSRDQKLHKGRTGAARLAQRTGAPIIPVGVTGTLDVQPVGSVGLRPFKDVHIGFAAPIFASDFGDPNDPRLARKMTDAVMFEIAQITGQPYVHTYAGASADEETPATMPEREPAVIASHAVRDPAAPAPTSAADGQPASVS